MDSARFGGECCPLASIDQHNMAGLIPGGRGSGTRGGLPFHSPRRGHQSSGAAAGPPLLPPPPPDASLTTTTRPGLLTAEIPEILTVIIASFNDWIPLSELIKITKSFYLFFIFWQVCNTDDKHPSSDCFGPILTHSKTLFLTFSTGKTKNGTITKPGHQWEKWTQYIK